MSASMTNDPMGRFSRTSADYIIPVQTNEDEWKNHLSSKELAACERADKQASNGAYLAIGGVLAGIVLSETSKIILGATVASAFSGLSLVAFGLAAYGLIKMRRNATQFGELMRRGERRKGDVEVFKRHGLVPDGFKLK